MPYWIRDSEGRLLKIKNRHKTELELCVKVMEAIPEDQHSQNAQDENINAYRSMRDCMHPPRMSAPSCIVPPTKQLVIRPHIVPLLPTFHEMESENPYAHIKEFEDVCNTLNEDIDMKAKIAAMARRLKELEVKKIREVQAISETLVQDMSCSICQSFEHLVAECPTIPAAREMFGDQANVIGQFKPINNASYGNTYNSNWRNHPNFSWKPRAPQYTQPGQAPPQASSLEQAIVNLSKVVGDFVGDQKSINAQVRQEIESINKMMDEMKNGLFQKIDNL